MAYAVLLTDDAAHDLEDIYDYIAQHDAPGNADRVLTKIEEVVTRLCESPMRGVVPPELSALGIREYREVFFKPYRIIYRIAKREVHVMVIADGQRDFRTLLQRRLLY